MRGGSDSAKSLQASVLRLLERLGDAEKLERAIRGRSAGKRLATKEVNRFSEAATGEREARKKGADAVHQIPTPLH